jgi:hypothetical protein
MHRGEKGCGPRTPKHDRLDPSLSVLPPTFFLTRGRAFHFSDGVPAPFRQPSSAIGVANVAHGENAMRRRYWVVVEVRRDEEERGRDISMPASGVLCTPVLALFDHRVQIPGGTYLPRAELEPRVKRDKLYRVIQIGRLKH